MTRADRNAANNPDDSTTRDESTTSGADVPDPSTWVTGDEAPTERQQRYLNTLARDAGEDVPDDLTKADASEMIDRLQEETGRGT